MPRPLRIAISGTVWEGAMPEMRLTLRGCRVVPRMDCWPMARFQSSMDALSPQVRRSGKQVGKALT